MLFIAITGAVVSSTSCEGLQIGGLHDVDAGFEYALIVLLEFRTEAAMRWRGRLTIVHESLL